VSKPTGMKQNLVP